MRPLIFIMASLIDASSSNQFDQIVSNAGSGLVVVHFWAEWAPQCQQMNDVMAELAKDTKYINVSFVKVEAESVPEISERYEIAAVPTFVLIKNKAVVDRVNGANAPELSNKVQKLATTVGVTAAPPAPKEDLNSRLKKLINMAPVMLFMKGTPQEPRCGFSRTIIGLLNDKNIKYSTFNILTDDEVRQGLKTFSNWPTYPQLYGNGELLGGLDIVKELIESGEIDEMLPKAQSLDDRLKTLINQAPVMLFMKGNPETPKCGFSRTTTGILNGTGVDYKTFDILQDEEVRQGLKSFSNWPTYPQLYVKGDLIGGLDIIKELQETDELVSTLKGE